MSNPINTLIELKELFTKAFNDTSISSESRKDFAIVISLLDICILQSSIIAKRELK